MSLYCSISQNLDWRDGYQPITISVDASTVQAISLMSQAQANCVLALEGEILVGLFTEQDIVRLTDAKANFEELKIADVMQKNPITITRSQCHSTNQVLALFKKHQIRYLPVLNDAGYPISLFTAENLINAIINAITTEPLTVHVEEALQIAEIRYRAVTESIAEGVVIQQMDGEITTCNTQAEKILGLTADQMVGRTSIDPMWHTIHEDGSAFLGETHPSMMALKTGQPISNVIMGIYQVDGSLTWISINSQPIFRNEQVEPYAVVTSFIDITARKQAEDELHKLNEKIEAEVKQRTIELHEAEQRFEFALQNVPIVIFSQDRDLRYTWIYNPALGYKANEVVGKLDSDIMPLPETARQLTEIKSRVLVTGIRERHEIYVPTEPLSQYYDLTVEPLFDEVGEIIGVTCVALDITNIKQAQIKLQENQYFTQLIVDISPDIIYIYDLQKQRNIYVNNAIASLGYSASEIQIMGKDLFPTIIHPDDLIRIYEAQKQLDTAQDRDVFEIEYRIRKADGEWRWFYGRDSIFARDEDGKVTQIVGNAQDITKRKLAEAQIKEIESQQKTILEHLPVGVIISSGIKQKMLYQNPRFIKLFGYSSQDFLTVEQWWLLAYPDPIYREWVANEWNRRIAKAINEQKDLEPMEVSITSKDGAVKYIRIHATIIGELNFVTFVDLTDLHKTAIALRESEHHLQTIVSQSSDGIIILNQQGKIVFANPAAERIFNLHIGELKDVELGIPITIGRSFEMDFLTSIGKIRTAEVLVTKIEWDNQPSYLTSIRDITDRKQVEEHLLLANTELTRATRLKDEFLANMSHELRTPLNSILGMSESLQEEILGALNDRQQMAIATIERGGQHLLELINDILDLAKIESGKLELHLEDALVQKICNDSLTFVKQLALKKNIKLVTQIPDAIIHINVDELRVRQALINLLTNAVKFTPEGGIVTLEVQIKSLKNIDGLTDTYIDFSVSDTGIGIAEQDIHKLFHTFVQIDSALNRKYAGTGLGLSLVKRIAEVHGGKVLLESVVDEGSRFTIRLPYQYNPNDYYPYFEDQASISTGSPTLTLKASSSTPQLILIVDDNDANIESTWSYLESRGYRLCKAKDGLTAIQAANTENPNLILMDIQMPVMDGLEAIKVIRTNPKLASIPIIALTALAMSGDREKCLEAGANEYLTKPVKLKNLFLTIQKLLQ